MHTKFFDLIMFVSQIQWNVFKIGLYWICKKVGNNYRILLAIIEYFFRVIFIHVLFMYLA